MKYEQGMQEKHLYEIVSKIPPGCVASYGQLGVFVSMGARSVGRAMAYAPKGIPCHRVVNSVGRLVPKWTEQRELLEREGVVFRPSGNVDMKRCRWQPL